MKSNNLEKAIKWLEKDRENFFTRVAQTRNGASVWVGHIYKIRRKNKPDVTFVVNVDDHSKDHPFGKIVGIKRICV
jgi:hypothetical protein